MSPLDSRDKSGARKNRISVGIIALCLLAGLLLAAWAITGKSTSQVPTVSQKVDIEDLRAKAEQGNPQAQKDLGAFYAKGIVVKQSYVEAGKWYRMAADQGHAVAQTALGELHEAGQGVARDDTQAAKWYRMAAEQGLAAAQYNLAVLYVLGKGVPPDNAEALKWYRKAADQGDSLAQYNLGMRYYEGKGVKPDAIEAYKWLSLAAAQHISDAATARKELKRRMTRQQISEAERRVNGFVVEKPSPKP
jgi:TPR repeat protein